MGRKARSEASITRVASDALRRTVVALFYSLVFADPSSALNLEVCTSADGHVYAVATTSSLSGGTEVTSVALVQGVSRTCVAQKGGRDGRVTSYAAGSGEPLVNRMRTTILSGFYANSVSCAVNFDPDAADGQGVLNLPGPGARTVSADATASSEALWPVGEADSLVPAAQDVRVGAVVGGCSGTAMTFPVPSGQSSSATRDGFLLQGDCTSPGTCQIIVFVGEQTSEACALAPSAAIAGFAVDGSALPSAPDAALRGGATSACARGNAYSAPSNSPRPRLPQFRGLTRTDLPER